MTMPISTAMNAATGAPLPGIGADGGDAQALAAIGVGIFLLERAGDAGQLAPAPAPSETPGFRRAPITSHTPSRLVRIDPVRRGESSPTIVIGTQMSVVSTVVP